MPVERRKSKSYFAVKLAVTILVLAWLSARADWLAVADRLASASVITLMFALVLLLTSNLIAAFRWMLLANYVDISISLMHAVKLTFSGLFLGQVLPGGVGGDAVRFWFAWRSGWSARNILVSLIGDRAISLVSIVLIVLVLSLPHFSGVAPTPLLLSSGFAIGLVLVALATILLIGSGGRVAAYLSRWNYSRRVSSIFSDARNTLLSSTASIALFVSLFIQCLNILTVWLIAIALHIPVTFVYSVAVVPIAVLLAALPVSINGWGVREGAMIAGFSLFGVLPSDALILSILIGTGSMIASFPGALFWKNYFVGSRAEPDLKKLGEIPKPGVG